MADLRVRGNTSRLCKSCASFDIRALYTALASAPRGKDMQWPHTKESVKNPDCLQDGVLRFHALHPSLFELQAAAQTCDFCDAILQQMMRLRDGLPLSEDEIRRSKEHHPIFIEMDQHDSSMGRPHVLATQYSEDFLDEEISGTRLAYFDVCRAPGREPLDDRLIGNVGLGRIQASDPSEPGCLELAKQWLDVCSRDHPSCRLRIGKRLPFRVLDVSEAMHDVRIVSGDNHSGQYAALSYCWGGERGLCLLSSTKDSLYGGISPSVLPKTLSDAVSVTQSLGLRYLWIDALCIQQDDPEDWAQQAAQMSEIYKGATVTLEIASSSKPSEGFLNTRKNLKPYVELEWRRPGKELATEAVQLRPIDEIEETGLKDAYIFSRGWTLQERALAPRTLSFGKQQISYECIEGVKDESESFGGDLGSGVGYHLLKETMHTIRRQQNWLYRWLRMLFKALAIPDPIRTPLGGFAFFNTLPLSPWRRYESCYVYWKEMVCRFSDRSLTVMEDRLPAIGGLAKEIQKATGDIYYAGHWRSELLESLAWETSIAFNTHSDRHKYTPLDVPTDHVSDWPNGVYPSTYVAPSWSWASVRTSISYWRQTYQHVAKIVDVHVVPKYGDPFGRLDGGYIDIVGPVLRIPTIMQPCESIYPFPALHLDIRDNALGPPYKRNPVRLESNDNSAREFFQHHQEHPRQEFAVLKILSRKDQNIECWLLLESCGDGTWRRLTTYQMDYSPFDFVHWGNPPKGYVADPESSGRSNRPRHNEVDENGESPEAINQRVRARLQEVTLHRERVQAQVAVAPFKEEKLRIT